MSSFNPFNMMMNMMGGNGQIPMGNSMNNPMLQMMNIMQKRNQPIRSEKNIPINQQQFKQFLPNIDDNILEQLAQQAKNQGMSEADIQAGINFIKNLK